MNAYSFIQALKFALVAAGKTDIRTALNTVCLTGNHVYGTDGHRASIVETEWSFGGDHLLLSRAGVEALVKTIKPKRGSTDEIQMDVGADAVTFSSGPFIVRVERGEGFFPDMTRIWPGWIVIPNRASASLRGLNAEYIVDAGKACMLLANAKFHGSRIYTNAAEDVVVFEPGMVPEDLPGLKRAVHLVMPMRL